MNLRPTSFALFTVAAVSASLGFVHEADAGGKKVITTLAGCNTEFRNSKGVKKVCGECVSSDGRYEKLLKNKGAWTCESGSGGGGGSATEDQKIAGLLAAQARNDQSDPWPAPLKAMPPQHNQYVTIQPGKFLIGTPRPDEHSSVRASEYGSLMTITHAFQIKTTEVTEAEWYYVTKRMPKRWRTGCLDCPVTNISWEDAIAYLNELSKIEKLDTCYTVGPLPAPTRDNPSPTLPVTWKGFDCAGYRLPTEAEWEFAGRGGSKEPTYGPVDDIARPDDNVENGISKGWRKMPVGGKRANAYGVYDMLGNVSEYVWDLQQVDAFEKPQTDPVIGGFQMTDKYADRTIRGWVRDNIAYRDIGTDTNMGGMSIGFRPVRTVVKK